MKRTLVYSIRAEAKSVLSWSISAGNKTIWVTQNFFVTVHMSMTTVKVSGVLILGLQISLGK